MSDINYSAINENFPVAGQDNDTQVFRDNFDAIKTSLRYAKEELEVFQDSTTGAAMLNAENNFNGNVITNANLSGNYDKVYNAGNWNVPTCTVDFLNGPYQIFKFGTSGGTVSVDFANFPTAEINPKVGKVTLEFYSDGSSQTVNFLTSGGLVYKKNYTGSLILNSLSDRVILEVWRHNSAIIFINKIGLFQ